MAHREMSTEEKTYYKKRLGWNILQLFLGTILLLAAYVHLQTSTAEKMSISSGVQVLSQKLQLRFHNVFNKDGSVYADKLNMEKNYGEVVNVVQNSSCKDKVDSALLVAKYQELQRDDVETYNKKSADYNKFLVDFYTQITDVCRQEVHTQQ